MKNKKLGFWAIAFMAVTLSTINTVHAGQNIAAFYGVEQKMANSRLDWFDAKKQEYVSVRVPLILQQNAINYYYLSAFTNKYVDSLSASMLIQDSNRKEVNDITINSTDNKTCNFERENTEAPWRCRVEFIASESSPVESNGERVIYTDTITQANQTADFNARTQKLYIVHPTSVGGIIIEGPDEIPNTLTAIAVSDAPKKDNVPLTVKINNVESTVKSLKFEFEFVDTTIADANGKSRVTCEITAITNNNASCTINITPYKVGKTTMKFLASSSWIDTSGTVHNFKKDEYQDVNINVGTLFAGYNSKSSDRKVYRKGSTLKNIETEASGSVIRGLAVDEPQHKLYVMTKTNLYRQSKVTQSDLKLSHLTEIDKNDSTQSLSLTDIPNKVIIGTGHGLLYQIIDKGDNNVSINTDLAAPRSSILSSTIDPDNNLLYFADEDGGFSIYFSHPSPSHETFETFSQTIDLSNMKVATYKGRTYAAGSYHVPSKGSELYVWDSKSEEMKKLSIPNNPFTEKFIWEDDSNEITSLFFTAQGILYATGSNGTLYYLSERENKNPQWKSVATNIDSEFLSDNAVDANGNIYLSSDEGIWKIPFDKQDEPYKLDNYGTNISAIVVDNNR